MHMFMPFAHFTELKMGMNKANAWHAGFSALPWYALFGMRCAKVQKEWKGYEKTVPNQP